MSGFLMYGDDCFDDQEHWELTLRGIARVLNKAGFVPPPREKTGTRRTK